MASAISCKDLTKRYGDVLARDTALAKREILGLLAAHAIEVQRFERGRPSLEDIFLRLVGAEGVEKATA